MALSFLLSFVPGDTLGSFVYVPCEVMKQRMQVQGTRNSWISAMTKGNISQKPGAQMYGYYTGMVQAGYSIFKEHGLRGLYAGYYQFSLFLPDLGHMFLTFVQAQISFAVFLYPRPFQTATFCSII